MRILALLVGMLGLAVTGLGGVITAIIAWEAFRKLRSGAMGGFWQETVTTHPPWTGGWCITWFAAGGPLWHLAVGYAAAFAIGMAMLVWAILLWRDDPDARVAT